MWRPGREAETSQGGSETPGIVEHYTAPPQTPLPSRLLNE